MGVGTTAPTKKLEVVGDATVSGNLSVGGTISYEDVTNIDSVGVITAQSGIQVTGGGVGIADTIYHLGDTNTTISFPAVDEFAIKTGGHQRLFVQSGRVLIGQDISSRTTYQNSTIVSPLVQLEDNTESSLAVSRFSNTSAPSRLFLQKGRGGHGSPTVVQNNDLLGQILFSGYDGSFFRNAAQIVAEVDGSPGSSDMPGALVLKTTADGAAIPSERLRITSNGSVAIGGSIPATVAQTQLTLRSNIKLDCHSYVVKYKTASSIWAV